MYTHAYTYSQKTPKLKLQNFWSSPGAVGSSFSTEAGYVFCLARSLLCPHPSRVPKNFWRSGGDQHHADGVW